MLEKPLLPAGFYDELPPVAAQESRVIASLLGLFESFGYSQVKPPMMEFEETLLAGSGAKLAQQTFRVMDAASHRMMGIRADLTLPVARLVAQRMQALPRPLRISYAGPVLRQVGEGLHKSREWMQAGCELVRADSPSADAAVVIVALEALKKLGVTPLSVDFTLPDLAPVLMDEAGIPVQQRAALYESIQRKDKAALQQHKSLGILVQVLEKGVGGGSLERAQQVVKNLQTLPLPASAMAQLERLSATLVLVHQASPATQLTLDVLERSGFEYHQGLCFAFFTPGYNEELGRGGRYVLDGTDEPATGFTLAVDRLLRVLPKPIATPRLFVPFGMPSAETARWREQGYVTIHGLETVADISAEAARLHCTHALVKGEIVAL